ncbi:RNA polymerase I-specific transcription initiation factor-domain-containing protein [Lineolata rhizophorae]|uniref:RNA polymerase I-specific transcription initiation factor-domain-containing protein n=1 Tax=Lineolata rhizophorae TaxID=578093 RepID=A0A6A6NRI5_9PEZI|nr:RNA polymerase I-specific transcription initiation factor-domain-containing protein [Lineolata rhizophorae]
MSLFGGNSVGPMFPYTQQSDSRSSVSSTSSSSEGEQLAQQPLNLPTSSASSTSSGDDPSVAPPSSPPLAQRRHSTSTSSPHPPSPSSAFPSEADFEDDPPTSDVGPASFPSASASDSDRSDESDKSDDKSFHARTWRHWTVDARRVADALERERASDLSGHLFNAFALRRRAEERRERKRRAGEISKDGGGDVDDEEWAPPKHWTAWPLEPERVPRACEQFWPVAWEEKADTEAEDLTYGDLGCDWVYDHDGANEAEGRPPKRRRRELASKEMEEVLVVATLKRARETWDAREEPEESNSSDGGEGERRTSREPSRSARSTRSPGSDVCMRDASTSRSRSRTRRSASRASSRPASKRSRTSSTPPRTSHGRRVPQLSPRPLSSGPSSPDLPTFLADDDVARQLLQPFARSIMAQLDKCLTALHQSRSNHTRWLDRSGGKFESTEPLARSLRRSAPRPEAKGKKAATATRRGAVKQTTEPTRCGPSVGRPRKKITTSRPLSEATTREGSPTLPTPEVAEGEGLAEGLARRRNRRGRPQMYQRWEKESYYMMHRRLAEEWRRRKEGRSQDGDDGSVDENDDDRSNAEGSASGAAARPWMTEQSPEPRAADDDDVPDGTSAESSDCVESNLHQRKKGRPIGLRDWSEVLGAAMLVGWDEEAVQAAAGRCTALFGEKMRVRRFSNLGDVMEVLGENGDADMGDVDEDGN